MSYQRQRHEGGKEEPQPGPGLIPDLPGLWGVPGRVKQNQDWLSPPAPRVPAPRGCVGNWDDQSAPRAPVTAQALLHRSGLTEGPQQYEGKGFKTGFVGPASRWQPGAPAAGATEVVAAPPAGGRGILGCRREGAAIRRCAGCREPCLSQSCVSEPPALSQGRYGSGGRVAAGNAGGLAHRLPAAAAALGPLPTAAPAVGSGRRRAGGQRSSPAWRQADSQRGL